MNRVLVAVPGAEVVVPLESRDALLEELRSRDDAEEVIAAFEAVGATRPVELDVYSQVVVVEAIRNMEHRAEGRLPEGLRDLLDALVDELHHHSG
jgi:class 3 adenylate cyclase